MPAPRQLVRSPALARFASRVVHRAPTNVIRAVGMLAAAREAVSPEPFGYLDRPRGQPVPLLPHYRQALKPTWARNWWPLAAIYRLRERTTLTPALAEIAAEVDGARTLPFPIEEIGRAVLDALEAYPAELRLAGRHDSSGLPVVEAVARPEELAADAASYRRYADGVVASVVTAGIDPSRSRMLDVGFGSGSLTFAMLGAGAGEVVGIDPEPDHYSPAGERDRMRELLAGARADVATLQEGDVQALRFPDAHFDVVFSATALEHVTDVAAGLRETARVLRRGGIAHHGVDPWFGPMGGHALCTLDFPWGHVRLDPTEFGDYVRQWRPHEAKTAVAYRDGGFQDPPLTARQFRRAARDAGFEIVSFRDAQLAVTDPHRRFLDRRVLEECRRLHPAVQPGDLLSAGYTVVLRRG